MLSYHGQEYPMYSQKVILRSREHNLGILKHPHMPLHLHTNVGVKCPRINVSRHVYE